MALQTLDGLRMSQGEDRLRAQVARQFAYKGLAKRQLTALPVSFGPLAALPHWTSATTACHHAAGVLWPAAALQHLHLCHFSELAALPESYGHAAWQLSWITHAMASYFVTSQAYFAAGARRCAVAVCSSRCTEAFSEAGLIL